MAFKVLNGFWVQVKDDNGGVAEVKFRHPPQNKLFEALGKEAKEKIAFALEYVIDVKGMEHEDGTAVTVDELKSGEMPNEVLLPLQLAFIGGAQMSDRVSAEKKSTANG